ncbi:MAG: VacB/RNase II family 3'-5' exoribonuclease [Cyanobacterium sp. T60_A2020_053]|nr:VacB/RNase II family 3'-5' exoribonuclease [Cyanobacterium sp. T60_A2020_053]
MEKGTLVEFKVNGNRRLAVIDKPEGKKDWIAIDQNGTNHKVKPQKIDYLVKGESFKPSDIEKFNQEALKYVDPAHLEIAWELLSEDSSTVTPQELAGLIFSEETPLLCYACHLLLSEDKIYFKKKADIYEPRPATQVEEIKHQLAMEAQRAREKEEFFGRLQQCLKGEDVLWGENDLNQLEFLKKWVLQPEAPSKQAQDLLESVGRSKTVEEAWQLLVDLKLWSEHENIFLLRSSYPNNFPLPVVQMAQSIIARIAQGQEIFDPQPRLDLTAQKVYTIDDESTREIDDGLSVETLPDGTLRYWIHIADPTRLISPHDALDLEARKRSTSLYLPTGMIPMFPPVLATGPMSLIQGQICPALSFGVILDDAGAVVDYQIHATLIKVTYRLSYTDVDEMLHLDIQAEPEIKQLAEGARRRTQWRKDNGSVTISMPEAIIKVKNEDDVSIELLDDSYSRSLVAEMMILTGEVAGRFCQENEIPVPFRGQPQPDLPPNEELILLPAGPVRSSALRRCMPKSETGLSPARHASLGLPAYTQVTSPIRRYTDLLAHFQIKAHLRGDTLPFARDEMQTILFNVTSTSYEAVLVERQTNRYWSLQYLQKHSDEVWEVLMLRWLREDEFLALILLEDIGLEFPYRADRPLKLGENFKLQVAYCDPHRDEIRFKEIAVN